MSSQIQTGHCKYMSREKMAFLADLRSIWIFNPNIFSSQSSRKVNGLNGLNEIHGINFDFYHRLTLSSDLCKRLQHCWPKTPTNVWSCCVRTFARSLTLLRRLRSYTTRMERCICIQSSLDPFGFHLKLINW